MASASSQASLTSASTGMGSTIDFLAAKTNVTMMSVVSGDVTDGVVAVEGSHDDVNWVPLHFCDFRMRGNSYWSMPNGAFRYFRSRIVSDIKGGGDVSTTFMEAG